MSIINTLILNEESRINQMIIEYNRELNSLVKGNIRKKKVKGNEYYYLVYREGDKVKTKYLGNKDVSLSQIQEQLIRRKQVEDMIKKLKVEQLQIMKLEALL